MRKVSYVLIATLLLTVGVMTVYAYNICGYELQNVGDYEVGNPEKTTKDRPRVYLTNETPNSDAQVAITLSKKGLFGYSYVTRIQRWITGVTNHTFTFTAKDKGTYRANVVFNDSNDDKAIEGEFYLTSVD